MKEWTAVINSNEVADPNMTCVFCTEFEEVTHRKNNTNTFTVVCKNLRLSLVTDHGRGNFHRKASDYEKLMTTTSLKETEAGRTLQKADKNTLQALFRNVSPVVKNKKPLRDQLHFAMSTR